MSKQSLISIPLDISDVRVLQTDLTQASEYILTVESTLESTICRQCGRTIADLHGLDKPRLLRHLPILGRPLFLRIRPKRFRCPFCDDHPTTTQKLDWYAPEALHTLAYERHFIVQLITSTISDVTQKEDVSYDAMVSVLDRWVLTTLELWSTASMSPATSETQSTICAFKRFGDCRRNFPKRSTTTSSIQYGPCASGLPTSLLMSKASWTRYLRMPQPAKPPTPCARS